MVRINKRPGSLMPAGKKGSCGPFISQPKQSFSLDDPNRQSRDDQEQQRQQLSVCVELSLDARKNKAIVPRCATQNESGLQQQHEWDSMALTHLGTRKTQYFWEEEVDLGLGTEDGEIKLDFMNRYLI
ncbi:hypothetical protein STEG23_033622 [Scotinomys teguina]